jgi:hypothetical protein
MIKSISVSSNSAVLRAILGLALVFSLAACADTPERSAAKDGSGCQVLDAPTGSNIMKKVQCANKADGSSDAQEAVQKAREMQDQLNRPSTR